MVGRLLIGIVKGLLVGGLVGFALAQLGFAAPGALFAYAAAAMAGVIVGLIAGKPIWAKDAKIEAGMKAFVGALLGAGLMYAARRWMTMPVPIPLGVLGGGNVSLGEGAASSGSLGGLAVTSLAMIAAVLGAFYEVDNDPSGDEGAAKGKTAAAAGSKRIAESADDELLEDEGDAESAKRMKK